MRKLRNYGDKRKLQKVGIIFGGVAFVLLIVNVALNASRQANTFVPKNKSLCQKGQNHLLLHIIDITRDEPECNKLIQLVQKTVYENKPVIYLVTPTYKRPMQKADLTRMAQTLMLVPNVHWIVIEDSESKTSMVTNFLAKTGISSTHLNIETPLKEKVTNGSYWLKPRGVLQRNTALSWFHNHTDPKSKGVVYFADDDNTYDIALFEEMRYTNTVSVWPVGTTGGVIVNRPLVKNNKVVGWNVVYEPYRPFAIDMAGFAVNLTLLHQHPEAGFSFSVPEGFQESTVLKTLVTLDELEPKAENCTTVLVWHTRTEYPDLKEEEMLLEPSNLYIEV